MAPKEDHKYKPDWNAIQLNRLILVYVTHLDLDFQNGELLGHTFL